MPASLQRTFLALHLTSHPPVGPVLPVLVVAHDDGGTVWCTHVTTMSNSRSYPVTPVTLQLCSSTPVAHSYSGHGRADMPLLRTTLGLYSIHSLPHLAIYPVCS